jgi:preprotein translocase subunit YajC
VGDFVTVASGFTGMVVAVGDGWIEVRFIDGRVVEVPTQSVEVVDVD